MKYTLSWITTMTNQACHLSLWPSFKSLDREVLKRKKEKRENRVLQNPYTTLLNYSLEELVDLFVINLIFYLANSCRNFGASFENKLTNKTWKSFTLPSYQKYIQVSSSNRANFSFHYKTIRNPPVTECSVSSIFELQHFYFIFTDLLGKNLTLLHFCCMLTHWWEKQVLMLSEPECVPEKLLSSSSPSAQFAHSEPPWISAESRTHYLDWYQHSVSVPQE